MFAVHNRWECIYVSRLIIIEPLMGKLNASEMLRRCPILSMIVRSIYLNRKHQMELFIGSKIKQNKIDLSLSHWGLVMPYGDIDLGQHWLR